MRGAHEWGTQDGFVGSPLTADLKDTWPFRSTLMIEHSS
jgi:hypothetical protein